MSKSPSRFGEFETPKLAHTCSACTRSAPINRFSSAAITEFVVVLGECIIAHELIDTDWYRYDGCSEAIICLNEYVGDLTPTESWSDSCQNCLHDMRIVGNA
jgi:hypothetical protein